MANLTSSYQASSIKASEEYKTFEESLGALASSPEYQQSFSKNPTAWEELSKLPNFASWLSSADQKLKNQLFKKPKTIIKDLEPKGPRADIVVKDEVTAPTIKPPSDIGLDVDQTPEMTGLIDTTFKQTAEALAGSASTIEADAERIRSLSEQYLEGKVPADVQAQIRRMTSERGLASALGRGQAGQALTARDLGLTSLQMQEAGVGMRGQAAGLTQAAAGVRDVLSKMTESRYQFDKSYELEANKLMEDMRRTDVDVLKIDQARRQFNAQQNLRLVELTAELATQRATIQANLAANDIDDSNIRAGFDSMLQQFDALIKKSAGST